MMVWDALIRGFNGHVAFRERRPGVVQVLAPLFHEDGDMADIFIDEPTATGRVAFGSAMTRMARRRILTMARGGG
jgi:hypothetical protein